MEEDKDRQVQALCEKVKAVGESSHVPSVKVGLQGPDCMCPTEVGKYSH